MQRTSRAPSSPTCSPRAASARHSHRGNDVKLPPTRWSTEEHSRYLSALELYPTRSWKIVAEIVGTRTVRQVMSHAQKIAQKRQRHIRGLKPAGRPRRTPVPVSPRSVENVTTATAMPSSARRLERRSRPRTNRYEPFYHETLKHEERIAHSGHYDEAANTDQRRVLAQAEAALVKVEDALRPPVPAVSMYEATHNSRYQWSHEDLEWFAELARLNGWEGRGDGRVVTP